MHACTALAGLCAETGDVREADTPRSRSVAAAAGVAADHAWPERQS